jgi:hypothetical protein
MIPEGIDKVSFGFNVKEVIKTTKIGREILRLGDLMGLWYQDRGGSIRKKGGLRESSRYAWPDSNRRHRGDPRLEAEQPYRGDTEIREIKTMGIS